MAGRLHGVVAMDGPSGTGKSTVSRRLAKAVGAAYLDTGAMYRAVTLAVLRAGVEPDSADAEQVAIAAAKTVRSVTDPAAPVVLLDGEDVEAEIRGPEVTRAVSAVSAKPPVRAALVEHQRAMIADEHRASSSRAATSAASSPRTRRSRSTSPRRRRCAPRDASAQDRKAGRHADLAAVLADVRRRDRLDSTRKTSPLHAAADALVLDTDDLPVDAVLTELLRLVEERGLLR